MSVTPAPSEAPPLRVGSIGGSARKGSGSSPLVPQRPRLLHIESAERSDNGNSNGHTNGISGGGTNGNGSNGNGVHPLLQQPPTLRQSSAEDSPSPLDHSRAIRPRFTPSSHASIAVAQLQGSPSVNGATSGAVTLEGDRMPALSVGPPALVMPSPRKDQRPSFSLRPPPPVTTTPPQAQGRSCCCEGGDCTSFFCCFRDSRKMCSSTWAGKYLQLSVFLQLLFTVLLPLTAVLIMLGLLMTRSLQETHEAHQTQQNLRMISGMQAYMQRNGEEMGWASLYASQLATAASAAAVAASSSQFVPSSLQAHATLTRSALDTDLSLMHLSEVVVDQAGEGWSTSGSGSSVDPGRAALYSSAALLSTVSFSQTFEWMQWQGACRDRLLSTSQADLSNLTWAWPDSLRPILFAPLDDGSKQDAITMLLSAMSDPSGAGGNSSVDGVEDLSALARYSPRLSASGLHFTRSYLTLHSSLLRTMRSLLVDTLHRTQRTGDTVGVESSAALAAFGALVDTQEIMLVQAATNLALIDALNATDLASGSSATAATAEAAVAALARASAEVDLRVQGRMTSLLGALSHDDLLALASRQQALEPSQLQALTRASSLQSSINSVAASASSAANATATLLALGLGSDAPTTAAGVLADSLVAASLLSDFGRVALLDPLDARTSDRFSRASAATIGFLFLIVFLSVTATIAGAYQVRTVWMLQRREHDRVAEAGGAGGAGTVDKDLMLLRQGTLGDGSGPASSRAFSLNLARQASFLGNPNKAPPPSPGLFGTNGNGGGGAGSSGGVGSFGRSRADSTGGGSGGSGGLGGGSAFFPRLSGGSSGAGVVANSQASGLGLFGSPSLRATVDASSLGAPPAAAAIGGEFVAPPSQPHPQPSPSPSNGSTNLSLPLDEGSLILMAGSPLRRNNGDRHGNNNGPAPHRSQNGSHGHGAGGKDRGQHNHTNNHNNNHRSNSTRPAYGSSQVSQFLQAEFENVMGPALLPRSANQHGQQQHQHRRRPSQPAPDPLTPVNRHHSESLAPINLTGFGLRSLEIPLLNFDALLPPDTRNLTDDIAPATPSSNWTVTHTHTLNDGDASATQTSRAVDDPLASAREMSTLHEENDVQALSTFASPCLTPADESARSRMGSPTPAARANRRNIIAGTISVGVPSPPKDASSASATAAGTSAAAPLGGHLVVPAGSGGGSGGGSVGPASASRSASSGGRADEHEGDRDPLVGNGVLFLSSQHIGQQQQQQHRNRGSSGAEHSGSSMSVPAADSPSPALVGGAGAGGAALTPLPSAVRFVPSTSIFVHSPTAATATVTAAAAVAGPARVLNQLRVSDPLAALAAYSLSNAEANAKTIAKAHAHAQAKANAAAAAAVIVHASASPEFAAPVQPMTPPLPPLFLSIAPLASAGLVIAASPGSDPLVGLSLTPRLDAPPVHPAAAAADVPPQRPAAADAAVLARPPGSTSPTPSPSLHLDRPSTTQGDGPSGVGSTVGSGSSGGGGGGGGATRTTTREGGGRTSDEAPHASPSSLPVVLRSAAQNDAH